MVVTPWGELRDLDDPDQSRSSEIRNPALASLTPRERLFAAMVGGCAQRGYEDVTVTDLLTLSGVARATFYELFDNKEDCFVATLETLLKGVIGALSVPFRSDLSPEEQARASFAALIELATAQQAAARLCLVEPFVVGTVGIEQVQLAIRKLRSLMQGAFDQIPGREKLPAELALAIIGGIHQVFFRRLHESRDVDLRELERPLWDWALSYSPPPQPLRLRGRRPKLPANAGMPPFAAHDPAERIIRAFAAAVAEKGYAATTIADISSRASISQRTFYEYFDGKPALLTAALDSSGMQMAAAVLPSIRRAPGWPESVRAGAGATCRYLAAEPDFARLRQVEIYAAGPAAIAQRDAVGRQIFVGGFEGEPIPELDPVAGEATVGALYSLYEHQIRTHGTESLSELAPLVTYITLSPYLGAERACEVANGDGR